MALTAITGVSLGRNARTIPIEEYFLRKESPQWEIQCASSMKTDKHRAPKSGFRSTLSMKRRESSISGERMTIWYCPDTISYRNTEIENEIEKAKQIAHVKDSRSTPSIVTVNGNST